MAEVLTRFSHPIRDGVEVFRVQACGAPMNDGRWAAWIEFIPLDGGRPLRSPRETTQPNRTDAEYWATGLSPVYLEGALQRAQSPMVRKRVGHAEAVFSEPAPDFGDDEALPDAVLDPVSIYRKGEWLLRRQLTALSSRHLINIVRAYALSDEPVSALKLLPQTALIERIVAGCQRLSVRL